MNRPASIVTGATTPGVTEAIERAGLPGTDISTWHQADHESVLTAVYGMRLPVNLHLATRVRDPVPGLQPNVELGPELGSFLLMPLQ